MNLEQTTFHRMLKFQHLLTPIAIDWWRLAIECPGADPREYKTLYLFGVRIATWRVDV